MPTEAHLFHDLANAFLANLGFVLANDPSRIWMPFRATSALYRSSRGLSLQVGFEPGDSNSAAIYCGREWSAQQELQFLSNYYAVLARRLGLHAPMFYKLGEQYQDAITMKSMLTDLQRTLPDIVARVTLQDLLCIEREEFGAERKAGWRFGPEYLKHVEVSNFPALSQGEVPRSST